MFGNTRKELTEWSRKLHNEDSHKIYSSLNTISYLLTPWYKVLFEQLTGLQLVKKFPAFHKPEVSLPHSQASATCLYRGPVQSSPDTYIPPPGDPS